MEELSELLDDFDVEFTWINKTTLGLIDPYQSIIKINLYLLIAETLMHEMVHWQIQNWEKQKQKEWQERKSRECQ